jgi:2-methylisocitrate lyase-like PEP mutase family enzyme
MTVDPKQSIVSGNSSSIEQQHKAEVFHSLHIRGNPVVLFNSWDPGSAKAVTTAGAKAIATSSWSVAAAHGFSDGEQVPLDLVIDNLRRIASAVDLPVSVDLESGYGDTSDVAGVTIYKAIEAGAIGCNLEDSFPANGKLRETDDQVDRISSARRAADQAHIRFFINARTDVFFQKPAEQHDRAMVDDAIERARFYAEAGADGLFVPGLVSLELISRLAEASQLPINVMVADGTASVGMLAQSGIARVSYGPRPYLLAMKALEDAARKTI